MRMRKSLSLLPLAALMAMGLAPAANAATSTNTFSVTASVSITCSISGTTLAFGTYTGAQVDSTSSLSVTCTNTTPYTIGLDAGTNPGATVTTRAMQGGGGTLSYALYSDSGRTANWGNTPPTDTVGSTGTGSAQSFTVYGRLPGGQNPPGGSYTDTITATVTY